MKQIIIILFLFTRHCVYIKIQKMKKKNKIQRGGFFFGPLFSLITNSLKGGGVVKKRKRRRRRNKK